MKEEWKPGGFRALAKNRENLICAYCGLVYEWIDHKHTQGFYEHEIDTSDKPCEFVSHKILREP